MNFVLAQDLVKSAHRVAGIEETVPSWAGTEEDILGEAPPEGQAAEAQPAR